MKSPRHLAQLTVLGCGLMFVAYAFTFLPFASLPEHDRLSELLYHGRWEVLLTAVPFFTGIFMAFFFQYRLTQGINRSCWTDAQLDQARIWVNAPALTAAQLIAILAIIIAWIVGHATHHHAGSGFGLILAVNPVTAVKTSLRKPPTPGPRVDWSQAAPVHSSHWGSPPPSA